MSDGVLARLAEIRTMDIAALKVMWRELFQAEPPPYNRKFLESRLAYRVQELAYGGLKPETLKRLAALVQECRRMLSPPATAAVTTAEQHESASVA